MCRFLQAARSKTRPCLTWPIRSDDASGNENPTDDRDGAWTFARASLRSPLLCRALRARKHDRVAIRIAQPAFPVRVLTAMARLEDVGFHLLGTRNSGVEIFQLKPEEDTIAVRPKLGIPKSTVMVLDLPIVQLEDQISVRDQSLVIRPAVAALAAKEALIPTTARLDILHANKGLETHNERIVSGVRRLARLWPIVSWADRRTFPFTGRRRTALSSRKTLPAALVRRLQGTWLKACAARADEQPSGFVDEAKPDSPTGKLTGQGEPSRTGTDDQHGDRNQLIQGIGSTARIAVSAVESRSVSSICARRRLQRMLGGPTLGRQAFQHSRKGCRNCQEPGRAVGAGAPPVPGDERHDSPHGA